MKNGRRVQIIASDAGGTMTDMIVVDTDGNFSIGKAATTPQDQSVGVWESLADAFEHWDVEFTKEAAAILPAVEAVVYSGTSMMNALLTATGRRVGVITQRGDEDIFIHERSRQTWAGYAYQDVLHHVAHHHNPPLVPRRLVKGVTGRIDMFSMEAIPLYEHEVVQAVAELLDEGVDAIAVCLWYSYLNPAHELRVAEIAAEAIRKRGCSVPVYLSHQLCPITREQPRLNTLVLHAFAAEPGRNQLFGIERKLQNSGYRYPLQIVLAHGGVTNIRYPRIHEACFSGPIGGLLGARYLEQKLGIGNWVCSDMGGTSFDVGLLMGGEPVMLREVVINRRIFNIPTLLMDTIGAGTGMYVTIEPITRRVTIGPGSAGADPGPVSYEMGNEVPTVMDCCLILGILNPDNYLGGKIKLNKEKAVKAIKEQCADVLNVDPYYLAEGVYKLINSTMKEHIRAVLYARGFSPADYCLLCYGGAGPMHVAGYTEGLPFKGVATVPYAAAFSSFGCAAVDISHRYQKSTTVTIPHAADDGWKLMMGQGMLNPGWDELEKLAEADFKAEGLPWEQATVRPIAYVRYGSQMDDIEVASPVSRINSAEDMDKLIAAFEDVYESVYAGVAKHPQAGYQIFELGLTATIPKVKPKLVQRPLGGKEPSPEAFKGEREVYHEGRWHVTPILDMDRFRPGNEIEGIAVIEAPSTTFFVPPGRRVHMDEWSMLWLT
ncbi:MAG: hydantoinase/oxoprolinase family protein [Deltaproteobacteria bacterium]|nr:hydantoinase/oxoprolinase family protein [Deltaproteobacteria bacterium]